jgi:hypothetical protein
MLAEIADDTLNAAVRKIVREELAALLESQSAELKGEPGTRRDAPVADELPAELAGVSPYRMVPFAEYVLREAGKPLHVRTIKERMYELGFKHRRSPANRNQLESSLNSLASPSQHPDVFERSGPRMLKLR